MPIHLYSIFESALLGKKNDSVLVGPPYIVHRRGFSRHVWKRKALITILLVGLLWFLFLRPKSELPNTHDAEIAPEVDDSFIVPETIPSKIDVVEEEEEETKILESLTEENLRDYDGDIHFLKLDESLRALPIKSSFEEDNVLFAASSLHSASLLLHMACEMARQKKNVVHFALLGRDSSAISDILEVNGIRQGECNVFWHDARADYSDYSSERRAELSAQRAIDIISKFLKLHVIITDDMAREDRYFQRGLGNVVAGSHLTVINVPDAEKFMWMTRLVVSSLSAWHKPSIDIVVEAPPEFSTVLIRMLMSLKNADYSGFRPPRLFVNLPPDIDPAMRQFLQKDLGWFPDDWLHQKSSGLTLHQRIPDAQSTPEEASIHFLESFYPTDPKNNHVLIISPKAEFSPLYFHYLYYHILEYKYSGNTIEPNLLGISFDYPLTLLDGNTPFPRVHYGSQKTSNGQNYNGDVPGPMLWEVPNCNAALYFGDKWAKIHLFVRLRLKMMQAIKHRMIPQPEALIGESIPAWMQYVFELMRLRGWAMVYPATQIRTPSEEKGSIVTIHHEPGRLPDSLIDFDTDDSLATNHADRITSEDSESSTETMKLANGDPAGATQTFLDVNSIASKVFHENAALPSPIELVEDGLFVGDRNLLSVLPFDARLPELQKIAYVSHAGKFIDPDTAHDRAINEAKRFRRDVGGCPVGSVDDDDDSGARSSSIDREHNNEIGLGDNLMENYGVGKGKGKGKNDYYRHGGYDTDNEQHVEQQKSFVANDKDDDGVSRLFCFFESS